MPHRDAILIPFRSFVDTKTRLAATIDHRLASSLARSMFSHVLTTCMRSNVSADVLVVTASEDVAEFVRRRSAEAIVEQTGDLNAALHLSLDLLRRESYARATIVAADLPLLNEADLRLLSNSGRESIAIAPNLEGRGTNGLSLPVTMPFEMRFGVGSARAHLEQCLNAEIGTALVHSRGLATDVDTVQDLSWVAAETRDATCLASVQDIKDVAKLYWNAGVDWPNDPGRSPTTAIEQDS